MTITAPAVRTPALLIGIVGSGVVHGPGDNRDLGTRCRRVREAGVFDYCSPAWRA